jgi:hypothetical protein
MLRHFAQPPVSTLSVPLWWLLLLLLVILLALTGLIPIAWAMTVLVLALHLLQLKLPVMQ